MSSQATALLSADCWLLNALCTSHWLTPMAMLLTPRHNWGGPPKALACGLYIVPRILIVIFVVSAMAFCCCCSRRRQCCVLRQKCKSNTWCLNDYPPPPVFSLTPLVSPSNRREIAPFFLSAIRSHTQVNCYTVVMYAPTLPQVWWISHTSRRDEFTWFLCCIHQRHSFLLVFTGIFTHLCSWLKQKCQ